ncbi:MAG: hypothetical protein ACP5N2_01320 [Candidatus Nanoarchaeia archaeon]
MEKDAILYKKVRDMFQSKKTELQIIKALTTKGHSKEEILGMIEEYKKDEASLNDDELVRKVESMFDQGKSMEDIYVELSKSAHPFEVKKAMLRANLIKFDYKAYFLNSLKSINLILIFVGDLILALFVNPVFAFLLPLLIITTCLFYVYSARLNKNKNESFVDKEMNKLKVDYSYIGGIHITEGGWGWTPGFGVYPKFWLYNLGSVFLLFHLLFVIIMVPYGFVSVISAVCMGLFSFGSLFFTHKKLV